MQKVVVMEPEFDGSTAGIQKEFEKLRILFGDLDNIEFSKDTLQVYNTDNKFDVILLHNSINHLDEDSCERLDTDETARQDYLFVLKKLTSICNSKAKLIICDCSNKNFYNDIGLKNPVAKNIEWHKHQPPEIWNDLLTQVGFRKTSLKWTSYNALSRFGRVLIGNRIVSYMLKSHFKLTMEYQN